jgi:hypothetical protein
MSHVNGCGYYRTLITVHPLSPMVHVVVLIKTFYLAIMFVCN